MRYFIIFVFFGITSCKFFEETSLSQQDPVNQKLVIGKIPSVDVLHQNNGVIDSFDELIWEVDTGKIAISNWVGKLRIKADSVGPGREFIYRRTNPLDFSNSRFLILKASVENKRYSLLQAELIDRNGNAASAIGQARTKEDGEAGKVHYHFEFAPSFFSGSKDKFDYTQVTEMRLYLHAAGDSYSGIIFLDELQAIRNP